MKVLFVVPANIRNGNLSYSTFIKSNIEGIKDHISSLEVFYFTDRNSLNGFWRSLKHLNKIISEFQPSIIHVYYGATTGALVALADKRCPFIINFGGSEILGHPNKGLKWRLREYYSKKLSFFAAEKADLIVCVSHNLSNKLKNKWLPKVRIIPNGVDLNKFRTIPKEEAIGIVNWNKGIKYVLFSLPRLNAAVKNLPLAKKVIEKVRACCDFNIELIVLNEMSQDYLVAAMNAADALLVTSLHEGSPNIVKESMSCNLPIISVDCGDVKERLACVENSYLCNYNVDELANSLKAVLFTNERSNGRSVLLSQGIDRNSTIGKILNEYKQLIN